MNLYIGKTVARYGSPALALAVSLGSSVPAVAALRPEILNSLPQDSILRYATPVPDGQLAGMRGRFVQGNTITRFGLAMVSTLKDTTGTLLTGELHLAANVSGTQPHVSFTSKATRTQPDAAATAAFQPGVDAGNNNTQGRKVQGVLQIVQSLGDRNQGFNDLNVELVHDTSFRDSSLSTGDAASTGQDGVRIVQTSETVGIQVHGASGSAIAQSINAGHGLRQLVRLQGDGLVGHNAATLQVAVSPLSRMQVESAMTTASVAAAVEGLRYVPH